MESEQGWLIGPGDQVLTCDAAGMVSFVTTGLAEADLLQLEPIDGDRRGTFRPLAFPGLYLTADATQFTPDGNVCLQFYGAPAADVVGPDGLPGWYQRWDVGIWASGIVTALVPYIEQGADHRAALDERGVDVGEAGMTWTIIALFVVAIVCAWFHGYNVAVKDTEERWFDAVGRARHR